MIEEHIINPRTDASGLKKTITRVDGGVAATYMADLLVAGGGDAGLCLLRPLQPVSSPACVLLLPLRLRAVLQLCLPVTPLLQKALVHLELLARLLPGVAALHLQLLDVHLYVLDVLWGDPSSEGDGWSKDKLTAVGFSLFSRAALQPLLPLVLVSKKPHVHLVIVPLKDFCRPVAKTLHFSPDQVVTGALQRSPTQTKTDETNTHIFLLLSIHT